jgi:hypothetical protein
VISVHQAPQQWLRQLNSRVIALALILICLSVIAEAILAFLIGPLMLVIALFTAGLAIPLVLQTVLHPDIEVLQDGLRLHPLIWQTQTVNWSDLTTMLDHPLVYNDPAVGRLLHGKNYQPREGKLILVGPSARLLPWYKIIGIVAGVGALYGFAISNTTHTGYALLLKTLQQHVKPSDL